MLNKAFFAVFLIATFARAGDRGFSKHESFQFSARGKWFDNQAKAGSYRSDYSMKTLENKELEFEKVTVVFDDKNNEIMKSTAKYIFIDDEHGFFAVMKDGAKVGQGYCTETDRCHYAIRELLPEQGPMMKEETINFNNPLEIDIVGSLKIGDSEPAYTSAYHAKGEAKP
jgi:hypothetical protein